MHGYSRHYGLSGAATVALTLSVVVSCNRSLSRTVVQPVRYFSQPLRSQHLHPHDEQAALITYYLLLTIYYLPLTTHYLLTCTPMMRRPPWLGSSMPPACSMLAE